MPRATPLFLCTVSLASLACRPDPPRSRESFAQEWAEVLCEKRTDCDCAAATCVENETNRFLQLSPEDSTIRPDVECFDERVAALEMLACGEAETSTFDWETRACNIWPSFSGFGENCTPPPAPGAVSAGCRAGLVCDAATSRCVNPFMAPGLGQSCLFANDSYDPPGVCAPELACGPQNTCNAVEDPRVPDEPPPILCGDDLYVF